MKKYLFLLLLPLFSYASIYPDFRVCYNKYKYTVKNSVPVTKNLSVTFDKKNCLKYDPFTGMCIIKNKNRKTIRFFLYPKIGWWAASVKKNEIYVGNFAKDEVFFVPAKLSVLSQKNSVITDMFCRAIGVGTGKGFIKADMVLHFARYGYWGDVGIEVDEEMKIVSFDPFYVKGIKPGEKVQKINYKNASPDIYNKYITKGLKGKSVILRINGKNIRVKIRKKKFLFTPLEHYGLKAGRDLTLLKIPETLQKKYFVKPGAKIVKVNGITVNSFEDLKKALSTYKNYTITVSQDDILTTIPLR